MINHTLVAACLVIAFVCLCNCDDPRVSLNKGSYLDPSLATVEIEDHSTYPPLATVEIEDHSSDPPLATVEIEDHSSDPPLGICQVEDNSIDRPLITCEVNSITVTTPLYEKKEFPPEFLASDLERIKEITSQIRNVSRSFLVDNDGMVARLKQVKGMLGPFSKMLESFAEQGRYDEFSPDYCLKMAKFITEILDSKTEIQIDLKEAHERTVTLMDALDVLVASTNNGIYLDYMRMTLDGMSFIEYMAPVVRVYKKKGYMAPIYMCNIIAKSALAYVKLKKEAKRTYRRYF